MPLDKGFVLNKLLDKGECAKHTESNAQSQVATGLSASLLSRSFRHGRMAAVAAPTRAEALSLFRSLLRTAKQFSDYNIREYTRRRAADAFRENRALPDAAAAAAAFAEGKKQLEVAKRQAVVYSLYAPKSKSVMELKVQ